MRYDPGGIHLRCMSLFTVQSFYRHAAALPLALPLYAGVLVAVAHFSDADHLARSRFLNYAFTVAFIGAWSAVPYIVYLAFLFGVWRPRTEAQFRRSVWSAPFVIGIPFGLVHAGEAVLGGDINFAAPGFLFWGGMAIGVGLSYAVLIEVLFWIAKWLHWIE